MGIFLRHVVWATALMVVVSALCTDTAQAGKKSGNVVVLKMGQRQVIHYKEFTSIRADNPAIIKVVRNRKRGGFTLIPKRRGSTTVRWTYKERGSRAFSGSWKYIVR
jgi:hypothetical protein